MRNFQKIAWKLALILNPCSLFKMRHQINKSELCVFDDDLMKPNGRTARIYLPLMIKKTIITLLWSSWLTIILHSLCCFLNVHCESPANRESLSEKISPKIFLIMQKLNSVIILSWKLQHTPGPSEALLSLNVSSAG